MNDLEKIGIELLRRRRELKMTQQAVAGIYEMDRGYLSEVESGQRNISILKFIEIAKALEIDPSELLARALK